VHFDVVWSSHDHVWRRFDFDHDAPSPSDTVMILLQPAHHVQRLHARYFGSILFVEEM
jgi:hypothetical protein